MHVQPDERLLEVLFLRERDGCYADDCLTSLDRLGDGDPTLAVEVLGVGEGSAALGECVLFARAIELEVAGDVEAQQLLDDGIGGACVQGGGW